MRSGSCYREGRPTIRSIRSSWSDAHRQALGRIEDGDAVIFCCPARRARSPTDRVLFVPSGTGICSHGAIFRNLTFCHPDAVPMRSSWGCGCFPPPGSRTPWARWPAAQAGASFRVAESEKYAHVTFFFQRRQNQPSGETTSACRRLRVCRSTSAGADRGQVSEQVVDGIGKG